jgi:hypothetical protein
MNNLIKFRFYDLVSDVMILSDNYEKLSEFFETYEKTDWNTKSALIRFTGLVDKNGNKVYEGDLLHWYSVRSKTGEVVIDEKLPVIHDDDCPGYYVRLSGHNERLFEGRMKWLEVAGNLYQNNWRYEHDRI